MTDTPRSVVTGEFRVVPDGGVAGCWRAGDDPPSPPTNAAEFVEQVGTEGVPSDRRYVLRVALADASEERAHRVVEQLDAEVDVLGTSLTLDVGPEEPGVFDVLVSMDYDPTTVTEALVEPPEVDAVTVSRPVPATAGGVRDDEDGLEAVDDVAGANDAAVSQAVAGADDPKKPEDDGDESGVGDDGSAGSAFDRLQETTERVGYDELLAELDETSLPGEFRDEVDLRPLLDEEGATDGVPAPPDENGSTDGGSATVSLAEPGADDGGDGRRATASPARSDELDADRVVEALVTAVEEDALDDEQRRVLGEAFDTGPPKTLLVRVDHLQREVDELTAYRDALEEFIEEYGTGESLVQQVREVLATFAEDAADLEREVATVAERIETVESELDAVRAKVADDDDVDERLAALEDELSAVAGQVATMEAETGTTVDELADELAATERRIEDLETWHQRMRTVLAGSASGDGAGAPGNVSEDGGDA